MDKISFTDRKQFLEALKSAEPVIGKTGGRYFKITDENGSKTVRLKDLEDCARKLNQKYNKNVGQQVNNLLGNDHRVHFVAHEIRNELENLDSKGTEKHKDSSLIKKIFTNFKKLFGNIGRDRDYDNISNLIDEVKTKLFENGKCIVKGYEDNEVKDLINKIRKIDANKIRDKKDPGLELEISKNLFVPTSNSEIDTLISGKVTTVNMSLDLFIDSIKPNGFNSKPLNSFVRNFSNLNEIKIKFNDNSDVVVSFEKIKGILGDGAWDKNPGSFYVNKFIDKFVGSNIDEANLKNLLNFINNFNSEQEDALRSLLEVSKERKGRSKDTLYEVLFPKDSKIDPTFKKEFIEKIDKYNNNSVN